MRVIPVMDIKEGIAVWARGGVRDKYEKLVSWLCKSSDPIELVTNYTKLGFYETYVADLTAILRGQRNLRLYRDLMKISKILLDCGIKCLDEALELYEIGIHKIIIATETLTNLSAVDKILSHVPCEKLIISIDLYHGKLLSPIPEIRDAEPKQCLRLFRELGFREAIIVDIGRVGTFQGPDFSLIENLCGMDIKLIVGGGIKSIEDIVLLDDIGVDGVLIASALHTKKISINELRALGYLVGK